MSDDQTLRVDGREVALSSLNKVLFPGSGITKGDLIDYYRRIAPVALPYFRDRPLSMQRFPDGIAAEGFFQKNVADYFPDWIGRVTLPKEGGSVTYVVANDAATLVYLANQACITPHLALARCDRPHHPDRMIFDLDPSDEDFSKVRRAAREVRSLLAELGLASFVQTTGSRGLHVVVPLDGAADFEQVRDFAGSLARRLAEREPDRLTVEQRKDKRGSAVFLDYLRNAYGQTAVAPYAVRPKEHAPVATPLRWDEVGASDLHPRRYTVGNIFMRLGQMDDPWAEMERCRQGLDEAVARLREVR